MSTGSPVGSHRVVSPAGALPQAADRLDATADISETEVRVRVERLNLDAASYRQLHTAHRGDGEAIRAAVLDIVERRGKMHNPSTGSGGMLIGTVDASANALRSASDPARRSPPSSHSPSPRSTSTTD
jgi:L-erythro-3,5-diaminohexanoate dehydrogenase